MTLRYSAQTLGLSNTYIFWRILMPYCKQGIIAGLVLAFARGLASTVRPAWSPVIRRGKTATISTTVYQLWCLNDNHGAFVQVMINLAISAVVLLAVNLFEKRDKETRAKAASVGVRGWNMSLDMKIKKNLGGFQLDVELHAGNETLALLGASGCGKV